MCVTTKGKFRHPTCDLYKSKSTLLVFEHTNKYDKIIHFISNSTANIMCVEDDAKRKFHNPTEHER